MLATLIDAPFDDPEWVFETKWDGIRMIAAAERGRLTLHSRNGTIVNDRYPAVATALQKLKRGAVLDGELVAIDRQGVSRFQLLQNALRSEARLLYCVFDIMFLGGKDLRGLPLLERKDRLRALLPRDPLLLFSEHRSRYGTRFFEEAERKGLEGIMAKRADSPYRSGERSADWLKIKAVREQEVVIAGFTEPRRSRSYFGALVLAVRDGKSWRYVGRVGTGFSEAVLARLHAVLLALRTHKSPFGKPVKDEAAITWVKPRLVAEVKFAEWTRAGEMRQPVFLGLRDDKRAEDVVQETESSRRK